jgi:hypothetical protein
MYNIGPMEMDPAAGSISESTWYRDIDPLNPVSGILLGCLIGTILWLFLAVLVMTFSPARYLYDLMSPFIC